MGRTRIPRSQRPGNKKLREEKETILLKQEVERLQTEVTRLEKLVANLGGDTKKATKTKKATEKPMTVDEQREATRTKFAAMRKSWSEE